MNEEDLRLEIEEWILNRIRTLMKEGSPDFSLDNPAAASKWLPSAISVCDVYSLIIDVGGTLGREMALATLADKGLN